MKPSSLLAAILFGTCLLRGPAASASPPAGGPYLLTGQLAHP